MNTELNFKRLGFFLKRQLYLNFSSMWIAIGAILGLLLIISALFAYFNDNPDIVLNLRNLYLVVYMLGGYIFTSKVFDEMHAPQKSYMFLTLPVSAAEKLLAAWFITSPVYVVVAGLVMVLLSFISASLAGNVEAFPYLFDETFFNCVGVYMVTQAVFFLGATTFRSNNFLKTVLALIVVALLIAAYTGLLGYILFGNSGMRFEEGKANEFEKTAEFVTNTVIPFLFWFVFAPFLLLVSYFKLKERQV
ncbi:hypothetical protein DXT99_25595 [Pontibacter diazotrophicus]|uniref:Uncharacterized protein n=1 Tax=Pontibacter diazotrophicus TaxID=1400979 RepID=A0A3D8L102_9BACT|nr:hypothetical protein [Pontibacter diazotrophicus]RDV11046.1 hypothetical protein DXT99_25595 [Pontibacter diazotrophicus]